MIQFLDYMKVIVKIGENEDDQRCEKLGQEKFSLLPDKQPDRQYINKNI